MRRPLEPGVVSAIVTFLDGVFCRLRLRRHYTEGENKAHRHKNYADSFSLHHVTSWLHLVTSLACERTLGETRSRPVLHLGPPPVAGSHFPVPSSQGDDGLPCSFLPPQRATDKSGQAADVRCCPPRSLPCRPEPNRHRIAKLTASGCPWNCADARMTSTSGESGPAEPSADQRLDSWKEIATYLKRDERTVRRWEAEQGLPVHRHLHTKRASVYAFRSEIDAWWNNGQARLEHEPSVPPATRRGSQ